MWEIPRFRIRAYLRSQKRNHQEKKAQVTERVLFKRTDAQVVVVGSFGEATRVLEARVVLNDLRPTEITLFSADELTVGEKVTFTMESPRRFYVSGRVTYCRSFELSPRIFSAMKFPFRMKIRFDLDSEQEAQLVREYCEELASTLLRGVA